eukprot:gene23694-biopygen20841
MAQTSGRLMFVARQNQGPALFLRTGWTERPVGCGTNLDRAYCVELNESSTGKNGNGRGPDADRTRGARYNLKKRTRTGRGCGRFSLIITSPDTQENWDGDSFWGWPGTCRYLTSGKPKTTIYICFGCADTSLEPRWWKLPSLWDHLRSGLPKNALGHAILGATAIEFDLLVSLDPPPPGAGAGASSAYRGGRWDTIPK